VKCPKCGYLGFESADRCKNCGYDFSLVEQPAGRPARHTPVVTPGDPPIHDARLARGSRYRTPPPASGDHGADRALAPQPEGTPVDLPLFRGDLPVLPPPRAPLAVRRATPTPTRIRTRIPAPRPDALPLVAEEPAPRAGGRAAAAAQASGAAPAATREWNTASPARRAAAAAIDAALIALVNLVVLHFTLALCGLGFNDLHVLPVLPMAAFLLVLNAGYLVLFTGTLGQTLGKMAVAIEVVPETHGRMDLTRAAWRGAALVVSLLPAGLGWLAGLVGDGRSLPVLVADIQTNDILRGFGVVSSDSPSMEVAGHTEVRLLRGTIVIESRGNEKGWQVYRDFYEVNTKPLHEKNDRLEQLFRDWSPAFATEIATIADASRRQHLGSVQRAFNVPTFTLMFLLPQNQSQFAFRKQGEKKVDGETVWVVGYEETKRPPMVVTKLGDEYPVHGELWVEPATGRLVKSKMVVENLKPAEGSRTGTEAFRPRILIEVAYQKDPKLQVWVPSEMKEVYEKSSERVNCTEKYTNYRAITPGAGSTPRR